MSYCPNGSCHIVTHPDQPAQSFCIHCNRRFVVSEAEKPQPFSFLQFAIAALITILLVGLIVAEETPEADNVLHRLLTLQQLG